jgi:carboxyl-terminal processing protease
VLPSLSSHLDVGEANLDYAIQYDEIKEAPHQTMALVRGEMLEPLRQASKQRIAQSKDFAKEERKIRRYLEQKQHGKVSLVEQKFLADRAELNAEKEEEKEFEELNDPNRPVFERNHYGNEALAVALDYVKLLEARTSAIGKR